MIGQKWDVQDLQHCTDYRQRRQSKVVSCLRLFRDSVEFLTVLNEFKVQNANEFILNHSIIKLSIFNTLFRAH